MSRARHITMSTLVGEQLLMDLPGDAWVAVAHLLMELLGEASDAGRISERTMLDLHVRLTAPEDVFDLHDRYVCSQDCRILAVLLSQWLERHIEGYRIPDIVPGFMRPGLEASDELLGRLLEYLHGCGGFYSHLYYDDDD